MSIITTIMCVVIFTNLIRYNTSKYRPVVIFAYTYLYSRNSSSRWNEAIVKRPVRATHRAFLRYQTNKLQTEMAGIQDTGRNHPVNKADDIHKLNRHPARPTRDHASARS